MNGKKNKLPMTAEQVAQTLLDFGRGLRVGVIRFGEDESEALPIREFKVSLEGQGNELILVVGELPPCPIAFPQVIDRKHEIQ